MLCEKLTELMPAPSEVPLLTGLRVPKVSLHATGSNGLYRNHPVATAPFGFAPPLSVASPPITFDADEVITVGAAGVWKLITVPSASPTTFEASAQ